jgi:hypothetical protein
VDDARIGAHHQLRAEPRLSLDILRFVIKSH